MLFELFSRSQIFLHSVCTKISARIYLCAPVPKLQKLVLKFHEISRKQRFCTFCAKIVRSIISKVMNNFPILGDPGPIGRPGADGVDGRNGGRGRPGFQGSRGEQGILGLKGFKGDRGSSSGSGTKGEPGDKGAEGPRGLPGIVVFSFFRNLS